MFLYLFPRLITKYILLFIILLLLLFILKGAKVLLTYLLLHKGVYYSLAGDFYIRVLHYQSVY